MPLKRLWWQSYTGYWLVALLAVCLAAGLSVAVLQRHSRADLEARLEQLASLVDEQLGPAFAQPATADVQGLCDRLPLAAGAMVLVTNSQGELLGASHRIFARAVSGDVETALRGGSAVRLLRHETLDQPMVVVVRPVRRAGQVAGAIAVAEPAEGAAHFVALLMVPWLLALLLSGGVALLVSRWSVRPVEANLADLRDGARQFAGGQLTERLSAPDIREFAEVVDAFNTMAHTVQQRTENILRRNNEQEAVLASMVEGVLAVDTEQRVISLNAAAARMLGTHLAAVQGRSLQEAVRNADLRTLVADALAGNRPVAGDIVLRTPNEVILQATSTPLRDAAGKALGAVIVVNDVTRLRQLENMRRDFAANVSHELKTPITSIKGFVETLLDGARHDPADAERFLRIVARQADRLDAIIEDLLSLSKIERAAETDDIVLVAAPVRAVLETALRDCETRLHDRQVRVRLECEPQLQARMNAPLLQQAVFNLLDNAIKYSEHESEIGLRGRHVGDEVLIEVRDQGCGIAEEHLARLFERFYRVDKARSRKQGGTGLGLAIVKHIVGAHRGHVDVQSKLGHGSTFTIHLPAT